MARVWTRVNRGKTKFVFKIFGISVKKCFFALVVTLRKALKSLSVSQNFLKVFFFCPGRNLEKVFQKKNL